MAILVQSTSKSVINTEFNNFFPDRQLHINNDRISTTKNPKRNAATLTFTKRGTFAPVSIVQWNILFYNTAKFIRKNLIIIIADTEDGCYRESINIDDPDIDYD